MGRRRKMVQLELPARGRGGRRPGAGRPKKKDAGVSHLRRAQFPGRFPLHITLKVLEKVGSLRTERRFARIKRAFRYGHDRFGMKMSEFSVQGNHIHLIVEAESKHALSRGMQGLAIRLAKGVNRASNRKGRVFADRYHAHILRTPAEVRNAVRYVLKNWQKHRRQYGRWSDDRHIDPYSSMSGEARWHIDALIVAAPTTWLLKQTAPP
jgi:putative transposase